MGKTQNHCKCIEAKRKPLLDETCCKYKPVEVEKGFEKQVSRKQS